MDGRFKSACTEFLVLYNHFTPELAAKVPKEFIDSLKENADENWNFSYDSSKKLKDQNILPETKGLVGYVYSEYAASPEQRKEYMQLYEKRRNERKLEMYRRMIEAEESE